MVVFTCSYCGDSVKKNQVEKHYQFSCRGRKPALTCVDCLKDFNGEAHIAHTSCVTEEERYAAKGFVSKPPSCKGKKKQENWEEFIRNIMESNLNLDPYVRNVLEVVCRNSGVPQKKPKFINYCKNLFNQRTDNNEGFESAWKFLEEKRVEHKKKNSDQGGDLDNSQNEINNVKEKDRKRKRVVSLNDSVVDDGNGMTDVNGIKIEDSNCSRKKEKKQKQDKQGKKLIAESSYEEQGNPPNTIAESKKEKKMKIKKAKYEKQLLEIQSVPVSNDCGEDQINQNSESNVKNKKKKKKQQEIGDDKEYSETVKNKHKKRGKHQDFNNENDENQEAIIEQDEMQSEVKGTSKFNWEETVVKLLEAKGDLLLKRVEKKVVNEYMNSGAHVESIEKAIGKFNKKILKMSRVKVKKDVVKLVS